MNAIVQRRHEASKSLVLQRETVTSDQQMGITGLSAHCPCSKLDNEEEMIACVNLDCEIRWYHLSCVGLDLAERVPNEGWLCPGCQGWHTSALLLQLHFLYKITLACLLAFKLNILKYTSWA